MTREFATRYAAALLRGNGERDSFEIAFPEQLDTLMVAEALESLGCRINWGKYRHYAVVEMPTAATAVVQMSAPEPIRKNA